MSSDTSPASQEARELSLIGKVELRIALADTDAKLQGLLQTYLAPLLLKLASESLAVRNKVIAVCQHINTRIQAPSIQLPVAALLKQFKDQKSQLVRHFDLLYVQQGIDRLGSEARVEVLVPLLQGIADIGTLATQGATVFNLVLRLLPLLKLPPKGSEGDVQLAAKLGLSDQDTDFLSFWFEKLLLLGPAEQGSLTCPGLSPAQYAFLCKGGSISDVWNPAVAGGLNLTETKAIALRFLASGTFTNRRRFIPALIATADANSRIADLGSEMLKRFTPDLEDADVVQELYRLYFGTEGPDGALPTRSPVQVKILTALGKSIRATQESDKVFRLIEEGLLSDAARSSQGLQASKLRTQIFTFTTWVVRMGSPSDIQSVAPKLISGLRGFIESQGWPSPGASAQKLPATDLSLRGLAYESIGILVPKIDFDSQNDPEVDLEYDLIRWLFTSWSADDSGPQIFVSIEQALGSLLNSSSGRLNETLYERLRPFLLHQMDLQPGEDDPVTEFRVVRSPHYAAVRFANRYLPFSDVVGRWIDLLSISFGSDKQNEIVEEGKKGLHPYWYRLLNSNKSNHNATLSAQDQSQNPWYLFPKFDELATYLFGSTESSEKREMLESSSRFKTTLSSSVTFARNILLWEALTTSGECIVEIEQDWDYKLDVLLSSNEQVRLSLKRYLRSSTPDPLLLFLNCALGGLVSGKGQTSQQCGVRFVEICSLTQDALISALVPRALTLKDSIYCNIQEVQDMATRAIGILASHSQFNLASLNEFILESTRLINEWKSAVGETAMKVRGALLGMGYILSRLAYRKILDRVPETQKTQFIEIIFDILDNSRDALLRRAAQTIIGQLSLSNVISPATLGASKWTAVREKLAVDAKSENEIPITTIGFVSLSFSEAEDHASIFNEYLETLYGLHEIRSPEVHFAVGDAMSVAAAGWESKSLVREFDVDREFPTSAIPRTVLSGVCDRVISGCTASKPSLRKASAIWLLALVKNCGHLPEVQGRLRQCQAAFARLLGDRDEIAQESGAQGLGLVYEMGDQDLKDDLVRDLVDSFTAANSNLGGGRVNADTELFEPGALPTGEGSSINTYKDIMNLASEAGDPSLVYRFMSLASNNAIWNNRAAFSKFGISSIFSDSSVNGYLAKNPRIYPKLYRYRFDPNPNVQRSMNGIWQTIVKDPNAVINDHFEGIMEDLLKSMLAGREWRVRQASCAAIADLIQGRQPDRYAKYISEILTKAFKVLDDIKETVRLAALRLCQTVTNSIIRTLETGDTDVKQANAMIEDIIPFLLGDKGMDSSVQEVQGFAVGALIQIIKKSPGSLLRPFVPVILEKFVNSLSSLEPQAVNYIHLNADKYGLTSQEIDKMRLSGIRMSPMMEATERYLIDYLDESNMKELAAKLEDVLRSAVGLPSKVGCSRVLVLLSMKTAFFRPYADRFIQLMTKYVVDRNETVSASYCTSLGYLMRLGSSQSVLKTIEYSKDLYLNAEDASRRAISAEIFLSISKLSNDRFMEFASTALPFVFIAKHDADQHVKESFEKTWQDNVGGSRSISLYLREITGLVSIYLDSPRWAVKHTAALAIADGIKSLDHKIDAPTGELLWPVLETALAGKTWDGKEAVLQAFVKFQQQARQFWQERESIRQAMKTITIREARRTNTVYRPYALRAMGEIAETREDLDLMPEATKIVTGIVDEFSSDSADPMEIDSGNAQKSGSEETLAACVQCLVRCVNPTIVPSTGRLAEYLSDLGSIAERALQQGGRQVQATLFGALQGLLGRLGRWMSMQAPTGLDEVRGAVASLAQRLLFLEVDLSMETVRQERARATVAYLEVCQQAGMGVSEQDRQTIRAWLAVERSESVRRVLGEALAVKSDHVPRGI
ncbi:hypothetical protein ASPZODRAFT_130907 [Penicilliopsis zonata CBS 506.65]|uniref:Proteasome component ECM29 n=1 Tax=Penicilliopsis zonata CBS 506.65 TaxID=1073090 RepID=A0A1L9SK61_9EURO|nr:hypothetical protein ASPZODRAFT_130907 [Penicilliopsis zonata CBS 506.65]OJJ47444.1 hypothetical protein ASPZODRAFT_130907 [Penicilliopsis zonata CBS 506.65]